MAWLGSSPRTAPSLFGTATAGPLTEAAARAFLGRVYRFMSLGLAVTGAVAFVVAQSPALVATLVGGPLFLVLALAQLAFVVAFTPIATRVSARTAGLLFLAYAALSGVTFSAIFLVYTSGSIAATFLVTAGMFGALSAYGALTKRRLEGLGSFAFMGLVGLVLASLVNLFLRSPMLHWLTTFAGVLVFTALTAYDTAKLKELGALGADSREEGTKRALQGALVLYLDFVNLFLLLLRIFGGRRRD
jgi:hypothetical protein